MSKLTKQENLLVAIQVNGESIITTDNGILFEEITEDSMLLYIKSKDEKTDVKIKITKKSE